MKTTIFQILFALTCWSSAWAQPSNDDCANAILLEFANSEPEANLVDGDTRGATASITPSAVCSQSFYTDDVWYKFTTPPILPEGGIVIEAYFDNITNPTDLPHVGMAVYAGCDIDEPLVSCYVDDDPTLNKSELPVACLLADQEYLVRIWSGGADSTTEGTFRIGAFAGPPITHILWWETFGGGLEANGWTTEGTCANADSNLNAGWKYLPEGLLDKGAYLFPGAAISSPTLCDGAVGVDSDYDDNGGIQKNFGGGPCPAPAQHILISPEIDASSWPPFNLYLSWNQAIRQHQSTFFFSFRTRDGIEDWSEWIDFQVNTEFISGGDFYNTDVQRHFLPGASGHDFLQIRFIYNANYYVWGLDDVKISVSEHCTDLSIHPRKCAIAPFAILPWGQPKPFPAAAIISNDGICLQSTSIVRLAIEDLSSNEIIYSNEITNEPIAPGNEVLSLFPTLVDNFTSQDEYQGVYSVIAETEDGTPYNNSFNFRFKIGGDAFAMEDGYTRSVAVANSIYDKGAPLSYAYGNYFTPNRTTCADRIVWGVNNPDDMKDYTVQVYLLEWSDLNQNQIAESNERKFIGFNDYTFAGDEGVNAIIETSLENFDSPGSPVMMEAGLGYMAMIEYQATSEDDPQLFLLASEARDYTGQQIASDSAFAQGLIEKPNYFSVLGFSPDGDITNIDYEVKELDPLDDRIFFGNDIVPLVRVVTNEKGCFDGLEVLSDAEKISVFPNPVHESLNVKLEFTKQHHGVQINLVNSLGQRVLTKSLNSSILIHTEKFDVRNLVAGSYHLQVESVEGHRTIPVVILH